MVAGEYRWRSGAFDIGIIANGGALSRIDWIRPGQDAPVSLLRPVEETALTTGDIGLVGCFPMVPFANRVENATFEFNGQKVNLPVSEKDAPHANHGFGCQSLWKIGTPHENRLRFTHDYENRDSGFVYHAWQELTAFDDRLEIEIGIEHKGDVPMPYGIGLHPWFPGGEDAYVRFGANVCFGTDKDVLPTTVTVIDVGRDFSDFKPIRNSKGLDVHYAGWDGHAELMWREKGVGLLIEADEVFGNLQFYIPMDGETFCVEPVSHVPNVHNRPDFAEYGNLRTLSNRDFLAGKVILVPLILD